MTISYNPNAFKGKFAEIYAETLASAKSLNSDYMGLMLNVKTEQYATYINASIEEQDYAADFDPATADKGGVSISDIKVSPIKKMFFTTVNPEQLRFTRFGDDKMGAGARNLDISEYENVLLDNLIPQMGTSVENAVWIDHKTKAQDVTSKSYIPNQITAVAGGLTVANIVAEVEKVWTAIPAVVRATGEARIYADHSVKDLILLANLHDNYKDRFVVSGDKVTFLGVELLFVPLGENVMLAGNKNEFIFATDLLGDETNIEIGKVKDYADILFYKAIYTRDTAIVVPSQKVLYI